MALTATDEYTVHKAYKLAGSTIESVCGGHNGIETRMLWRSRSSSPSETCR